MLKQKNFSDEIYVTDLYTKNTIFVRKKLSACLFINEAEREIENFTTKPEIIVATDFVCSTVTRNKAKLR